MPDTIYVSAFHLPGRGCSHASLMRASILVCIYGFTSHLHVPLKRALRRGCAKRDTTLQDLTRSYSYKGWSLRNLMNASLHLSTRLHPVVTLGLYSFRPCLSKTHTEIQDL